MVKKYLNFISGIFFMFVISVSASSFVPVLSREFNSMTAGIIILFLFLIITYLMPEVNLKLIHINQKTADRIFCIMAFVLLMFQLDFAFIQDFTPKNDLLYICTGAENLITRNPMYNNIPDIHKHYFAVYPNNHMILTVIYILDKLEYITTGNIKNIFPVIFNIISLDISYIFMYKISGIINTPEKSVICAVRGLLLTPFVTYSAFFYTDSMAMPYITGAVYFYLKYSKSDMIISGILIAVGYKFKGSAGLLIPAVILDMLINRRKDRMKNISVLIIVFILFCKVLCRISAGIISIGDTELEKYRFPLIHWVMMSLHGRGGYCAEDFRYTLGFNGYENKINADISRIGEKFSDMGFYGFLNHLICKISYTWRDGTYMAGYYNKYDFLRSYGFYIFVSVFHFKMLYNISDKYISEKDYNIIKIIIMILALFLIVWEARCRYLVSFFPLFILV